MQMDVETVLAQLTLEEKVSLLSGTDFWHTKSIPRLKIPALRLSDGPNGVRGTKFFDSTPAACLPCGTGLGATWDIDLLSKAGHLIAEECKAKGAHVWLGPTINIQRSPLGGRGFESYSEDPLLSGLLASAIIQSVQHHGIASAIKHFVCNDMEHERKSVDCVVGQRALREIYLLPFQLAVRDARPWAFMTAYNRLNGQHVSEEKHLLQGILRDEWNWEGLVTSDWYGTYSTTEAVNAGLDLEMPGPTEWRGRILANALRAGKVSSDTLDERARAVLRLVNQVSSSGIPERAAEHSLDSEDTSKKLRHISAGGLVLLKNDNGVLPLQWKETIAVIGPNAKTSPYCGGGSAWLRPYHSRSIYDALSESGSTITYALGCQINNNLPVLGEMLRTTKGRVGYFSFTIYIDAPDIQDRIPIDYLELDDTNILLADYQHPKVKEDLLYASLEGELCPQESGDYDFGLTVAGTANLYIDDRLVIDNSEIQRPGDSFFGSGTIEERNRIHLEAGKTYHLRVDFGSAPTSKTKQGGVTMFGPGGVRLGCSRIIDEEEEIEKAVEVARNADQVVLCCGLSGDWESEGFDRPNMHLPGLQDRLIAAVSKVNPRTVVVLQSGTPVTVPWADQVSSIVQAWYGGNELGDAVADILFGTISPSGKLPLSWPKRIEDNPAFLNYRSDEGKCIYGEDLYVGYRYYEKISREVQWPFGFGLSYATFELQDLDVARTHLDTADETLLVSVQVKNTSTTFDASEVVQVYIAPPNTGINRPLKELKGFSKVFVERGRTKTTEISIPIRYASSHWSDRSQAWVAEQGTYKVLVGTCSDDTPLSAVFEISKRSSWNGV